MKKKETFTNTNINITNSFNKISNTDKNNNKKKKVNRNFIM